MNKIITRKEAIQQKLSHYYTGKVCRNGHIDRRALSNNGCMSCMRAIKSKWQTRNIEKKKIQEQKWRDNNRDRYRERARRNNKAARIRDIEKVRLVKRTCNAKYEAAKLQRCVKWADSDVIASIYANCPTGYHVDHIIPLQGKLVSGLHNEFNLQYLTISENCSKSNKYQ